MNRCEETTTPRGLGALLAGFGSEGKTPSVRCQLDVGHEGKHRGRFQPFPGFADEMVFWSTEALMVVQEQGDTERPVFKAEIELRPVLAAVFLALRGMKEMDGIDKPRITMHGNDDTSITLGLP